MKNLRITDTKVTSNSIEISFNQKVTSGITVRNFSLTSETPGTPDVVIDSVDVRDKTVTLNIKPLTYNSIYLLKAFSSEIRFLSRDQESLLLEDGINNEIRIQGPVDIDNPVFSYYKSYFKDNIYDIDNNDSIINKYLKGSSQEVVKLLYETNQIKSDRFLSYTTTNEQKTRGLSAFDRLDNEGAYVVTRVGLTPSSDTGVSETVQVTEFGSDVLSLSQVKKTLVTSVQDEKFFNIFDKSNLIFNLDKNLIKISKLEFTFVNNAPNYSYDLAKLGYQLLVSKYDDYSFSNLQLKNHQAKLSDNVLLDKTFDLSNIFRIEVEYYINDLGKNIHSDSLEIYSINKSTRETLEPISNILDTQFSPITDTTGAVALFGGLNFLNVQDYTTFHSAFLNEIKYDLSNLPNRPGDYSVDYLRGKIYVYGSVVNNGSGDLPPVVSYLYKKLYKSEIDYVFDDQASNTNSLNDLVALPHGSLLGESAYVSYVYDSSLAQGTDYDTKLHIEVLNERINNRYKFPNVFITENSPLTAAFRVYNETSGEIYQVNRFSGNKIYVTGNSSPKLDSIKNEKINFSEVNETLVVSDSLNYAHTVLKIFLQHSNLTSNTQGGIGYSLNTSVSFSDISIFQHEKWFSASNITNLNLGEYCIDYVNGIVYVAVDSLQNYNLGNISYKYDYIATEQSHVTNVFQIARKNSINNPSLKDYTFGEIQDKNIQLQGLESQLTLDIAGVNLLKIDGTLTADTTSNLFSDYQINHVVEFQDLVNNSYPVSFPFVYNYKSITVHPSVHAGEYLTQFDGYQYYVDTGIKSSYLNPNFVFTTQVAAKANGIEKFASLAIVENQYRVYLVSGLVNQLMTLSLTITANDLTRFVVDYNAGDLFVDYEYLSDEIVVSYEYGDNVLDFRESDMEPGTTYYVNYKAGTLREGLNSFASLLRVPELQAFDTEYDRESFRDAVMGGLSSFLLGSTAQAINNLVNAITHIMPEIKETLFEQWILGDSFLHNSQVKIQHSGLEPVKYHQGPKFLNTDSLELPFSSNINLQEGTFSTWFKPSSDIIENSAELSIRIQVNDINFSKSNIYLGAQEYNPSDDGMFTVKRESIVLGRPQLNKTGVFIFLEKIDDLEKWHVLITNNTVNGQIMTINVASDQKVFDLDKPNYTGDSMVTKQKGFSYKIITQPNEDREITFIAAEEKFIFDTSDGDKNRMSLSFDAQGYLNFKVIDKNGKSAVLSTKCATWKADDLHHLAVGWKLGTVNKADELHLFVDGQEVANTNYWGENYNSISDNSFRSKHLDRYIGKFTKNIIGSTDLITLQGVNKVNSSVNFSNYGIVPGDILYINEQGFDSSGYSISSVNGQTLELTVNLPVSMYDASFSVNKASLNLKTKNWLYPRIIVLKAIQKFSDFGSFSGNTLTIPSDSYKQILVGDYVGVGDSVFIVRDVQPNIVILDREVIVFINLTNANFTVYSQNLIELKSPKTQNAEYYLEGDEIYVTSNVSAGDLVFASTLGLSTQKNVASYYSWTDDHENIIKSRMPTPIDLTAIKIKHKLLSIPLNAVKTSPGPYTNSWSVFFGGDKHTSVSETGRTLDVSLTGTNLNFNPIPTTNVYIQGTNSVGNISEYLYFSEAGTQTTINKYLKITTMTALGYAANINKSNYGLLEISEHENVLVSENSSIFPELKYSYVIKDGFTLASDGYVVSDVNQYFSYSDLGNYLYINDPTLPSGIHQILQVVDNHTLVIDQPNPGAFTNGKYQILRAGQKHSGFQNGYFIFEQAGNPGQKYFLSTGEYVFDFNSNLTLDFQAPETLIIGNNWAKNQPLKGSLDQIKIENVLLEDVRIREINVNKTITSEYNSLKPVAATSSTMFLLQGLESQADYYDRNKNKKLFYTNFHINENFGDSIHMLKPLRIENLGIFNPLEGTISFWLSLTNDSHFENRSQTVFDFYGSVTENLVSSDRYTLNLDNKVSKVLSVKIPGSDTDYFVGGTSFISLTDTVTEDVYLSTGQVSFTVSQPVQQIVSIFNTLRTRDLFGPNGYIASDRKTIYPGLAPLSSNSYQVTYKPLGVETQLNKQVIKLGKPLPNDVTQVSITYLPENFQGDRMSLTKDLSGNLVYQVTASQKTASITCPIDWSAGTWHKVKLSYSMKNTNQDTLSMWIDGYQQSNTFGYDTTYIHSPYDGYISSSFGNVVNYNNIQKNLNFQDQIQYLVFGSRSDGTQKCIYVIDDLKFTNQYNEGSLFAGERFDLAYSKNLENIVPSVIDLYTTYLLTGKTLRKVTENFSYLRGKGSVNNDFYLNIFDSFDIVKSNDRVKLVLEKLVKLIKPASSRVYIKYLG